jgi:hypothetical protein
MRGALVIGMAFIIVITVFFFDERSQRNETQLTQETAQPSKEQREVQAYLLPESGGSDHNGLVLVALGVVFLALGTMCPKE